MDPAQHLSDNRSPWIMWNTVRIATGTTENRVNEKKNCIQMNGTLLSNLYEGARVGNGRKRTSTKSLITNSLCVCAFFCCGSMTEFYSSIAFLAFLYTFCYPLLRFFHLPIIEGFTKTTMPYFIINLWSITFFQQKNIQVCSISCKIYYSTVNSLDAFLFFMTIQICLFFWASRFVSNAMFEVHDVHRLRC